MVNQAISMFSKQYLEHVRSTHSSIYYICVCYHQNLIFHKDRVNTSFYSICFNFNFSFPVSLWINAFSISDLIFCFYCAFYLMNLSLVKIVSWSLWFSLKFSFCSGIYRSGCQSGKFICRLSFSVCHKPLFIFPSLRF